MTFLSLEQYVVELLEVFISLHKRNFLKARFCISLLLYKQSKICLKKFKQHVEFRVESPFPSLSSLVPAPENRITAVNVPVFFQTFSVCIKVCPSIQNIL